MGVITLNLPDDEDGGTVDRKSLLALLRLLRKLAKHEPKKTET